MRNYRLGGYQVLTVEVRWAGDHHTFSRFVEGLNQVAGASMLPGTMAGAPLEAMVEGLQESTHWVRIEGTTMMVMMAIQQLMALCEQTFDNPQA